MCRLHHLGVCSTCGPGTSAVGQEKLAAQLRLFGAGCPVLACAVDRGVGHCLRDCDDFPCEVLAEGGGYPLANRFLEMQRRRRRESGGVAEPAWPKATAGLWEELSDRKLEDLCILGAATAQPEGLLLIQCLNESWQVDVDRRTIVKTQGEFGGEWDRQLPFLALVYLAKVDVERLDGEMTTAIELYHGVDPFVGRNEIKTGDFESLFGRDKRRLDDVTEKLGGTSLDKADVSARFHIFPKLPVELMLWLADEEFPAKLTVLFDRSMPRFYPVDAAAAAVNLLLRRLQLEAQRD